MRSLSVVAFAAAVAAAAAAAVPPHPAAAAAAAVPPHPRLLLNDTGLAALRASIEVDPVRRGYYDAVAAHAASSAARPPTPYPNCTAVGLCRNAALYGPGAAYIDAGGASDIITYCALMHRLNASDPTVPSAWSDRAVAELLHVAGLPSWYWPVGQALERAALAFGVAVGYDWLHAVMTPAQRATVEDAMGRLALTTRLADEREGKWWTHDDGNWNVNSNAMLLAPAAALADVPGWAATAAAVRALVHASLPAGVANFEPVGVWPEGPGYSAFTLSSLASGCAADGGWGDAAPVGVCAPPRAGPGSGVCAAGLATAVMLGPSGQMFNWGDAHAEAPATAALFWAAGVCGADVYAAAARAIRGWPGSGGGATILDLLWYSPAGSAADLDALPLAHVFDGGGAQRKAQVGVLRSGWAWPAVGSSGAETGDAPTPPPVALLFKAGDNAFHSTTCNNHGHMDVGSWVYEAGGQRWVDELGPDAYDFPLLAYFGRFRWGYYLTSSAGHNVLGFDGDAQHAYGSGAVRSWSPAPAPPAPQVAFAELDNTLAYAGTAAAVSRTFSLIANASAPGCALAAVWDQWELRPDAPGGPPAVAVWRLHTRANVTLTGLAPGQALLTAPDGSGAALLLTAEAPAAVTWSVGPLPVVAPQAAALPPGGVRVLTATVPAVTGSLRVTLDPCPAAAAAAAAA